MTMARMGVSPSRQISEEPQTGQPFAVHTPSAERSSALSPLTTRVPRCFSHSVACVVLPVPLGAEKRITHAQAEDP